jgi:hypothetical protein
LSQKITQKNHPAYAGVKKWLKMPDHARRTRHKIHQSKKNGQLKQRWVLTCLPCRMAGTAACSIIFLTPFFQGRP